MNINRWKRQHKTGYGKCGISAKNEAITMKLIYGTCSGKETCVNFYPFSF